MEAPSPGRTEQQRPWKAGCKLSAVTGDAVQGLTAEAVGSFKLATAPQGPTDTEDNRRKTETMFLPQICSLPGLSAEESAEFSCCYGSAASM